MSKEVNASERELYNDIVEMLSNGNFLQLNGKAINLTELNEYINAQGREIERLRSIIKEVRECVETAISEDYYDGEIYKIKKILDKENI